MSMDRFVIWATAVVLVLGYANEGRCQQRDTQRATPSELFALKLIAFDLQEAGRIMTIVDRNEDGEIDQEEQQRLRWKSEVSEYDLSRDGKLSHLEVAIREARRRVAADVNQFDVNNVNTFLRRHDKNNNRQLDPEEITEGGWPSNPEDYDADGDGTLTEKELQYQFAFNRGLRRQMGIEAIDQTGAMRLIRRFDKDGDKRLSADEYENVPLPRPAKEFDENDDGMLAIIEISTMLAKHRRDAGLTKPDVTKIRRMFERVDLDGDGRITKQERTAPLGESPVENAEDPYEAYDTNKDGTVTIAEVEKIVAAVRKERGYIEEDFQKAVSWLRRHDENRNKTIERSELFDAPKVGQLPKSMLERADRDDDQRINLDELSRYMAAQRKAQE